MTNLTTLENQVLEAINDLLEMFPDSRTIESSTLISNVSEYGLNNKQVRAVLVTLQEKNIIKLFKMYGIQHIELL